MALLVILHLVMFPRESTLIILGSKDSIKVQPL